MTTSKLVCTYLQLRGELASAYAAGAWRSYWLGHIERVAGELRAVEHALDAAGVDDELYGALVSGRLG
jgi:hypothetical protein